MSAFFSRRRPTPAMAVAFVALLAALSGTAVALPGRNTVDSGDLKRGAVKRADIGRNAITGVKVRNGSLGGPDLRDGSLTGEDIDESKLGQVPSADTANTAGTASSADSADSVDGASFARINYRAEAGSAAATPILDLNGLTLSASCSPAVELAVSATTAVDDAMVHWEVAGNTSPAGSTDNFSLYDENDNLDTGAALAIADNNGTTSPAPDSTQGTLTYARPDGGIVTATFMMEEEEDQLGGPEDCFVIGHAQSSN
jgi:hypothetical protein